MGFPSRSAWLASISSTEYEEFKLFAELEPLGLDRLDTHVAAISMAGIKPDSFRHKPPATEEQARQDFFDDEWE